MFSDFQDLQLSTTLSKVDIKTELRPGALIFHNEKNEESLIKNLAPMVQPFIDLFTAAILKKMIPIFNYL